MEVAGCRPGRRAIDAYEALAFDDVIVVLQPMTGRSLDRLAEPLRLRGR
jgi:hypothetical protein